MIGRIQNEILGNSYHGSNRSRCETTKEPGLQSQAALYLMPILNNKTPPPLLPLPSTIKDFARSDPQGILSQGPTNTSSVCCLLYSGSYCTGIHNMSFICLKKIVLHQFSQPGKIYAHRFYFLKNPNCSRSSIILWNP